ncbi:MAG: hypothetical protein BRD47_06340 [Bacteroidetes bacterium QS_8_68_28]|nr:MAG: hypothetical protein BRD47_06340 [Bacteroidetes bacterium QS_8_68_28]
MDQAGITCSVSCRGDCYDNAVTESFFSCARSRAYRPSRLPEPPERENRRLPEYIEAFYNRKRRHSALGYPSPAEYEARLRPHHRRLPPGSLSTKLGEGESNTMMSKKRSPIS